MWDRFLMLIFMIIGGTFVHFAWQHAWNMYKRGKAEGQGLVYPPHAGNRRMK